MGGQSLHWNYHCCDGCLSKRTSKRAAAVRNRSWEKIVITKQLIAEVQDLKENKNWTITQIAKLTGKGRNTIYKVLKEKLDYVPYNRLVKQEKTDESKSI